MEKQFKSFEDPAVEAVFSNFPDDERRGLLQLRELIFQVAAKTEGVGEVLEALRWGQPSYLTPHSKSGSTIRLGLSKSGGFAIFTHCQSTIMSDFQAVYNEGFNFDRNRAVHFKTDDPLTLDKLELLVHRALTYHMSANQRRS